MGQPETDSQSITPEVASVDSMLADTKSVAVSESGSPASHQPDRHPGPRFIGQFELQETIGIGGFGIVYKANDTVLNRTVAVKIPKDEPDEESRAAFLMEARAAARLDHSGIVRVYDAGEIDGQCFQVSSYCSGGNLSALIASGVSYSWQAIAKMAEQLANAMQHAHERGVVHRDLKPANIVLAAPVSGDGNDEVPELCITDFGLARLVEIQQERSESSQLVGTPCYMSPEQLGSARELNSALSDLYSLGVILYELLTGQKPYQAKSFVEVVDQIRDCYPEPPSAVREGVPAELEIIALKCMSEDPADRYSDCGQLASELQRFANGEPIHSYRPTASDRIIRWLKSPRRMVETGSLSILVGIATPLWIAMILIAVVVENLEADITAEMIPQALLVCFGLLAPLVYIGYQIRAGNRKWLWPGLVFSLVSLFLVAPPLFGNVYVFPKLYERYPLGRIIAYSLLTMEHALQVVQYLVLIVFERDEFSRRKSV